MKLAKKKYVFYEVPIKYRGRSYAEGKKLVLKMLLWLYIALLNTFLKVKKLFLLFFF